MISFIGSVIILGSHAQYLDTVFSSRNLLFRYDGFHSFFYNNDVLFSSAMPPSFHDVLSSGVLFHSIDNSFHRVPSGERLIKSPYDSWYRSWIRNIVLGQVGHRDVPSVWTQEVLGGRGIGQYPKNFKRQSFAGKLLLDFGDKASVGAIQKKGSCCLDFLLYGQKTSSWCSSFPFKSQGLAALQTRQSWSQTQLHLHKTDLAYSFLPYSYCSFLFLTNKCPH